MTAKPCETCAYQYTDAGSNWCAHEKSDTKLGLHTTYEMRYLDEPCGPLGSLWKADTK